METKDKCPETTADENEGKHLNFAAMENNEADAMDAPAVGELAADEPNNEQKENIFDILLDLVNYSVKVTPFVFNEETRYYVSVDDGPTNLFLWDVKMSQIRSLDDSAFALPDGLEAAISSRLMQAESKNQL